MCCQCIRFVLVVKMGVWWQIRKQFSEMQQLQKGLLKRENELAKRIKAYEDEQARSQQAQAEARRQVAEIAMLKQKIQELSKRAMVRTY